VGPHLPDSSHYAKSEPHPCPPSRQTANADDEHSESRNDKGSVTSSNATLAVVTPYPSWQLQYFGCTNCPQAAPNADPMGLDRTIGSNKSLASTRPTRHLLLLCAFAFAVRARKRTCVFISSHY